LLTYEVAISAASAAPGPGSELRIRATRCEITPHFMLDVGRTGKWGIPKCIFARPDACAWMRPNLPALAWLPVPCTLGHRATNAKELNSLFFIAFSYISGPWVNRAPFWVAHRNLTSPFLTAPPGPRRPAQMKSGIKKPSCNLYKFVPILLPTQAASKWSFLRRLGPPLAATGCGVALVSGWCELSRTVSSSRINMVLVIRG
jgi:hypothetical protein